MRPHEAIVEQYLRLHGFAPKFEPDGQVPPDFLIEGGVAVEARVLNEHFFSDDVSPIGLEAGEIEMVGTIERALRHFDRPQPAASYWVSFDFTRPIARRKEDVSLIIETLRRYLPWRAVDSDRVEIRDGLTLHISSTHTPNRRPFRGLQSDGDSGGQVSDLYIKNVQHCVYEKTGKIAGRRDLYPTWWLVLTDCIEGFSASNPDHADEIAFLKSSIEVPPEWDRVIVLEVANMTQLMVIEST